MVGTELAVIKPYMANYSRGGCSGSYVKQMDKLSLVTVRITMDTILKWMSIAATGTGTTFHRLDAHIALLTAITRAEQKCR